jgi:cell division protein DivIC
MKKLPRHLRNKYILTTYLFLIYILFLDDFDIFTIINQQIKLSTLEKAKIEVSGKLKETQQTLKTLRYSSSLESYAREEKFFKKDNEEIFVITNE